MKDDIKAVKSELKGDIKEVKMDIKEVKNDMKALTARQREMELYDMAVVEKMLKECAKK